ncbi:MlaD family protein [Nocardia jejuensis]|uniref:MlaD family protein n=1 Tax=Nocardia jejuensis TaxID=328049 RepID=UPI000832514E|nr:MlaD family protein [Nocardia jejuensis]
MPNYAMAGVGLDRRRALLIGAAALVVIMVAIVAWRVRVATTSDGGLAIRLHTAQVGDGIVVGTQVRADGVRVGEVTAIEPDSVGTQSISVRVDGAKLDGLDDSLRVDYATSNLFGISEIELRSGPGGAPLRDGSVVELTGARAADAYDATMGSLLRSLGQVGGQVLTPELSNVLAQLAGDVRAFTPLLQALVVTARTFADTQRIPLSQQLGAYGTALSGLSGFAAATIAVIDQTYKIDALRDDRPRFDATIEMVVQQLFPGLQRTMYHADAAFSGYAALLVPILSAAAKTVPTPEQSGDELRELLDRLRAAMPDTPEGPVLNLDVDLRGVPGVAVPLLGAGVPR